MLLKKLEMIGFKSFADRTEFLFEPGVTALVGPNGCGKSNVVDAIKWILGEQSVKSLRGSEMADIIFNGTANRKSLGFAEATLTFDNTDRKLPLEFDEVTVTRRVYRTGEGEYFINKSPCRLKDVKNLILDTGMGMQCYSVIEQGRIDQILQASTAERRKVFDEAAGISKYKARRKEAQAKLERVGQNLLRVNDIVDEVEKQLRSVKYQAAKARRYREYTEELKKLRTSYSLNDYDVHSKRRREVEAKLSALGDERTGLIAEGERLSAKRSEQESRGVELERAHEQAQGRLAELKQALLAAEDAIRFSRTRIEEQAELRARYEQQLAALDARVAEMQGELASRQAELSTLAREGDELTGMLDERATRLAETDREETELETSLEEKRDAVVDLKQQVSRAENDLGVTQSERRALDARRSRLAVRMNEVGAEVAANENAIHHAEEEIAAVDRIIGTLAEQSSGKESERVELGGRLASMRETLEQRRQDAAGKQSRVDLLRDLDEKLEGVEQGVREVLAALRAGDPQTTGLHGMIAEKLNVEPQYARAVESALGHRAQTIMVEGLDHALAGVRMVNESGRGRASFLPLSNCTGLGNGHDLPAGAIGWLADFVRCEEPYRKAIERLLGEVVLVEDMQKACEMKLAGTNGHMLVTPTGECLEPTGIITGGRGTSGGGIISRATERRTLEAELDALRGEIARLEGEFRAAQETDSRIASEIGRLAELAEQEKTTRTQKLTAIERLKEKQSFLGEERRVLESEEADARREGQELEARETELRSRLEEARREDAELESRIETLTQSYEELATRRAALQEEMTELKVKLAQTKQRLEGMRAAMETLNANLRIASEGASQLRADIDASKVKEEEAKQEISRRETELEGLQAAQAEQERVVLKLTNARETVREETTQLEHAGRELQALVSALENDINTLRLEEQELKLKMEALVERVREEYQLDLVEMHRTYQPEQMNWEEVHARIEELRLKIANMGNVNLDAIADEDALVRRSEFLGTQRQDLLDSKAQLEEIIDRLNKQSLEYFMQSFAKVRENFQEMFRKLFGGGKADLFLENEQDILESGIEIIARPPGKEPRALSLLSGGEKVMTAVALLFAIFKAKPSPFCVLDEVDAALDEANIGRFGHILTEFLTQSQFIIITHSKRTMAVADIIYGITMQESGVSKKVAVKFEEYEQQVA